MKAQTAISRANALRPNALGPEQKYAWLYELEGKLAEQMGIDAPTNPYPNNAELMIPAPYDNVYELYIIAMIDYYNNEVNLYTNDMQVFNAALDETKAWLRRTNCPQPIKNWSVM